MKFTHFSKRKQKQQKNISIKERPINHNSMSRRAEIEAKKQRLAELRRLREEKQQVLDESNLQKREIVNTVEAPAAIEIPELKVTYREISIQTDDITTTAAQEKTVKAVITYNKSTQTIDYEELERDEIKHEEVEATDAIPQEKPQDVEEVVHDEPANVDDEVLASFLQSSFRIINNVLEDDKEILKNYSRSKKQAIESFKSYVLYHKLSLESQIYSIDVSPLVPNLIVISTGTTIHVYNLKFQRLESEYHSSTKILNVQFAKFNTNLIIGSGYNGKVSIWDMNPQDIPLSLRKFPILESNVSAELHSMPIWCLLQIHNDKSDNVLLTSSTDGKIITWNPQMLAKPKTEAVQLKLPRRLSLMYDELTPLVAIQLPTKSKGQKEERIVFGSEDGNIYKLSPSFEYANKIGAKSDADLIETIFEGHTGPVTDMDVSIEFPGLFISSAMDWKMFLWDVNFPTKPLLTVYKTDSIMSCKWRPEHPTQLGYVYEGWFELLDLSINTVNPVLKIQIDEKSTINKMIFDRDGQRVHLTDVQGNLYTYELLIPNIQSDVTKFKRKFVQHITTAA